MKFFIPKKGIKKTQIKKAQRVQKIFKELQSCWLFEAVCIPNIAGCICKTSKTLLFRGLHCVKKIVRQLLRSIIDDNRELGRTLECTCTYLDKYEVIDLPIQQHDDSSQEHTGVGMAPTLDTKRTSVLAPCRELIELEPRQSNGYYRCTVALRAVCSMSRQLEDLHVFVHAQAKSIHYEYH